ncbi:unnamed protein product [Cutaneotrichosporon oleaginosum]
MLPVPTAPTAHAAHQPPSAAPISLVRLHLPLAVGASKTTNRKATDHEALPDASCSGAPSCDPASSRNHEPTTHACTPMHTQGSRPKGVVAKIRGGSLCKLEQPAHEVPSPVAPSSQSQSGWNAELPSEASEPSLPTPPRPRRGHGASRS